MSRWGALLLLLLLPLTMAPKIALVPEGEPLQIEALVSRLSVRTGTPVTTVLFIENVSGGPLEDARLDVSLLLNERPARSASFVGLPRHCTQLAGDGTTVSCSLGDFADGQTRSLRLTVRPNAPGELSYNLNVAFGSMGTSAPRVPIEDVVIRVSGGPAKP